MVVGTRRLHVSRTSAWEDARRSDRRLRAGRHALRDGDGEDAVSRRHAGGRFRSPVESAATLSADVEPGVAAGPLAEVIDNALEKDPERRYRSARDFLQDLRRVEASISRGASPASIATDTKPSSSLVVLPFLDMSAEKDQEYFCNGITEEIINTLTRVPGLRVISRTSAFAFQGKDSTSLRLVEDCESEPRSRAAFARPGTACA